MKSCMRRWGKIDDLACSSCAFSFTSTQTTTIIRMFARLFTSSMPRPCFAFRSRDRMLQPSCIHVHEDAERALVPRLGHAPARSHACHGTAQDFSSLEVASRLRRILPPKHAQNSSILVKHSMRKCPCHCVQTCLFCGYINVL